MSSNPIEQGSEAISHQDNILENVPRSYRQAWARMTPSQRAEACEAIFTGRNYDKKKPQASVLTEISKHRGWSNGMQFKEIARNLSPTDKGQACFEVASARPLSDNFYATAVCEWLLVRHLSSIGMYLDKAGIPNQGGSMDGNNETLSEAQVAKLFHAYQADPADFGLAYFAYLMVECRSKKNKLWQNAEKALAVALGRQQEKPPLVEKPAQAADKTEPEPLAYPKSTLTMYERSLVRALVDGAISRTSNLKAEEAEQMVRQLIDAAPSKVSHCFLLGFAQALHGRAISMLESGSTGARIRWHVAGYVLGRARYGARKEAYESLMASGVLLDKLLEEERQPHPEFIECGVVLAQMFAAAEDHARLSKLCGMLRATQMGRATFMIVSEALDLASKLTSDEKNESSVELIDAAVSALKGIESGSADDIVVQYYIDVADYQRASALLGMKKFKEAQAIYSKIINNPESSHRMGARVWMSLSKAGVTRVEEIFPQGKKAKFDEVVRKLAIVSDEVAAVGVSRHRLAQICNGLWLQHSGKHADAIKAFDLALAGMPADSSYRRRKIQQWTSLCRAVSLVHELNDEHRHDIKVALLEAKEAGIKPASWYLLEIASPLGIFADHELVDLLGQMLPDGDLPSFNKTQWETGSVKSDPRLQVTYLAWLESSNEPQQAKWDQAAVMMEAGWRTGGQAPEDALDFLSFLAFQDGRLAGKLIEILAKLGPSDGMLSLQELTTLKARLHASRGELQQAVGLLTPLFFSVANAHDQYLQHMALAVYEDVKEMKGDLAPLESLKQKLLAQLEPDEALDPDLVKEAGDITVMYVGGNETQKRYEEDVRKIFASKYPNVSIEYFCPGWSSNWNKVVDVIRPKLAKADGMLLSYYVRTMFGRTIRRACPDNCPWWGADGHGKASIIRGLEKAIQHAALRKARKS
jgi:tetratricopeptide (TPR) repeat protein